MIIVIEKIRKQISKTEIIVLLAFAVLIAVLIVIAPFIPDGRPRSLRNELTRQGYDVAHVDFTFVKDIRSRSIWVFQSSEPILSGGNYIQYWQLTRRALGFGMMPAQASYSVVPYQPVN